MASEASSKAQPGPIKGSTFRLEPHVLDDMDYIAAHFTRESGVSHTKTDAIRVAVRRLADAIRKQAARK